MRSLSQTEQRLELESPTSLASAVITNLSLLVTSEPWTQENLAETDTSLQNTSTKQNFIKNVPTNSSLYSR